MKYCVRCGTKLREEANFCYVCGTPCDDGGQEPEPVVDEAAKDAEVLAWDAAPRIVPAGEAEDPEEFSAEEDFEEEETEYGEPEEAFEEDAGEYSGPEALFEEDLEEQEDEYEEEEDEEEDLSEGKKTSYVGLIIFAAVIILLAVYAALSPARRTYQAVLSGNDSEAAAIYEKSVAGNALEERFLKILGGSGAKWAFDSYNIGKLTYDRSEEILNSLSVYSGNASWRLNQLETLKGSKKAYSAGIKALEEQDYPKAISSFAKVLDEDTDAADAADKLASAELLYVDSVKKDVDDLIRDLNYQGALELLAEAVTVLPGRTELEDLLKDTRLQYASLLKKDTVPVVKNYIEEGYYKEAIDLLNNALAYNSDDDEMKALLNTAILDYEGFVQDQVSIYIGNKDYDGALTLLSRAMADIPDHQVFMDLYKSVKSAKKKAK